ncbi:hypothetical protein GQ600_15352 [Phytophthora cactorum]|nr:hypothetical protein GQ600_15352 [Phytophthora cactorum]
MTANNGKRNMRMKLYCGLRQYVSCCFLVSAFSWFQNPVAIGRPRPTAAYAPVRLVQLAVLVLHRVVLDVAADTSANHLQHVRGRIVLWADLHRTGIEAKYSSIFRIHTKVAKYAAGGSCTAPYGPCERSTALHASQSEPSARPDHSSVHLGRECSGWTPPPRQSSRCLVHQVHAFILREVRGKTQISREHERLVDRSGLRVDVHLLAVRRDATEVGRVLLLAVHDDVADDTATSLASGDHVHQRRLAGTVAPIRATMRPGSKWAVFDAQVRRRERQTAALDNAAVRSTRCAHFNVHLVIGRLVRGGFHTHALGQNANAEPDVLGALLDGEAVQELLALGVSVPVTRELRQHVTTQRPGDRREPVHPDPVVRDQVGQDDVTREQEEEAHRDRSQRLAHRDTRRQRTQHRHPTHEVEEGAKDERYCDVHWDLYNALSYSVRRGTEEVTGSLLVENLTKLERDGDLLPRLTLEQRDAEEDHTQVVRRGHVVVDHAHDETDNERFKQLTPQQRRVSQPDQLLPVQQQHSAWDKGQPELGSVLRASQIDDTLRLLKVLCTLELVLVEALADGVQCLFEDTGLTEEIVELFRRNGEVLDLDVPVRIALTTP